MSEHLSTSHIVRQNSYLELWMFFQNKKLRKNTHTYENTHIHIIMQYEIINAYYEWHMHTATHDAGRFLMRRRSYCDLRGISDECNDFA